MSKDRFRNIAGEHYENADRRESRNNPDGNRERQEIGGHAQNFGSSLRNVINRPDEHAVNEVKELLQNINSNANRLSSLQMEHRSLSLWDLLPVVSNIRSHLVANKEADAVAILKDDMQQLQHIIRTNNLKVDLKKLQSATDRLGQPGGITKWAATILPFFRWLHRSATPQRAETVHRRSQGVRQDLRRAA